MQSSSDGCIERQTWLYLKWMGLIGPSHHDFGAGDAPWRDQFWSWYLGQIIICQCHLYFEPHLNIALFIFALFGSKGISVLFLHCIIITKFFECILSNLAIICLILQLYCLHAVNSYSCGFANKINVSPHTYSHWFWFKQKSVQPAILFCPVTGHCHPPQL